MAGKFAPGISPEITHLGGIVEHTRREIIKKRRRDDLSRESAREYWDEADELSGVEDQRELFDKHGDVMFNVFGDEWWYSLPEKPNPKYQYLCRVINTVKDALRKAS